MEITNIIVTYKDKGEIKTKIDDRYCIASYLNQYRINAFLSNPNIKDQSRCMTYLSLVDGVVAGRAMFFPIQFKNGAQISDALSGSALEVHKNYRHLAVGADIVMYPILSKENKFLVYSGLSDQALQINKKLKFKILSFPRMMFVKNARCIIESYGVKGVLLKGLSAIVNLLSTVFTICQSYRSKNVATNYIIEKVDVIPDWIDDITVKDGHKYMEIHDVKWFQWNLDYNYRGLQQDIQAFYTIKKENEPIGFFMIKERFREVAGGRLNNICIGSIVEWGSRDETILSETDINLIALSKFSKDIDIIEFASNTMCTLKDMKKYGFIQQGYANIAFKDLTKQCDDAGDISLWRVRYGYADVILT